MNTLKSRKSRTSYKEGAISVILKIKSLNTLSNAICAAETRFKKIRDIMK